VKNLRNTDLVYYRANVPKVPTVGIAPYAIFSEIMNKLEKAKNKFEFPTSNILYTNCGLHEFCVLGVMFFIYETGL